MIRDQPGGERATSSSAPWPCRRETSDTARLRWVSNQPVAQAIIGARSRDTAARCVYE
jgi:hypothetical protein